MNALDGLPIHEFRTAAELRAWLQDHHDSSGGVWLRIYKKNANVRSVTFEEILDEGLCFGWSESKRLKYDGESYLQRFTPRKTVGTCSPRNLARAWLLVQKGKMKPSGLRALGIDWVNPLSE
jgi:uncharacterized protein YdeI (YjbR/CyaY-like superfamily)